MELVKNAISWFEIPVTDFERAKKFYEAIFDYEMPEMTMDNIRMGFLPHDREGGIGGAICHGEGYQPATSGAKLYLNAGADLSPVVSRVESAGGTVTLPKTSIGEWGSMAFFTDTEGNSVGLHSQN